MNAALVHAVLARAVNDPLQLAKWTADPQALRAMGVDPSSLDLAGLRHFSGLALKVRHNGLRSAYPQSFRLIDVADLEIELFAAYAVGHAQSRQPLAASDEARAQALIDFVQHWHDPAVAAQSLLWDLLRHEQTLSQLAVAGDASTDAACAAPTRPSATSVPHVRGAVRLLELQHDPRQFMPVLRQRAPELAALATATCQLCYWRAPGENSVMVVELDDFGFAVMRLADGRRRVADIAFALGLGRRVTATVLGLLRQLQQAGLLAFAAGQPSASTGVST